MNIYFCEILLVAHRLHFYLGITNDKRSVYVGRNKLLIIGNCILDKTKQDPNLKKDYTREFELD